MTEARILIVEDDWIVAQDIRSSLERLGFTVSAMAASAEEAISKAKEEMPDLVLMDIGLEGHTDGIEAAKEIHSRFSIPVVYVSAYAGEEVLERAKTAEPFGYIVKPFEDRELKAAVEIALFKAKIEKKLKQSEQWLYTTLKSIGDAVIATDTNGYVTFMNPVAESLTGWNKEESVGKPLKEVFNILDEQTRRRAEDHASTVIRKRGITGLANHMLLIAKDGTQTPIENSSSPIRDEEGDTIGVVLVFRDIKEKRHAERALHNALDRSRERQAEVSAMLEATRAVLEHEEFKDSARSIFDSCKNLIGATAGYVALLSADGAENEVVFLESGGPPCTVDPRLPMPIRGLREKAYRTGKAVYENEFSSSKWMEFMPEGHVGLENVLFGPLVIEGKVVGLLGLANKPGGFTENDAKIAAAFGEFTSIALYNSRTWELLENSEERFRSLVETANDAIISVDSRGNIALWNEAATEIFEYSAEEVLGKSITILMPEQFRNAHADGMNRLVTTGTPELIGKTVEMAGLRKDGTGFPLELSLATWRAEEGVFFTGIVRDITERKLAEGELRKAHDGLELRVQERTAELTRTNELLQQEVSDRKRAQEALSKSEQELRRLSSELLKVQEDERKRISRELHDSIGQSLAAIKFGAENVLSQMRQDATEASVEMLESLIPLVQQASDEVRRIHTDLRPSLLDDLGIVSTVSWFCREFEKLYSGIRIEKGIDIEESQVPEALKTAIFRVLQEALNNIAKHGNADHVKISLRGTDGQVKLAVEDNGQGFDVDQVLSEKSLSRGIGLTSMKERTELSGGSFSVQSTRGAGTTVRASWQRNSSDSILQ